MRRFILSCLLASLLAAPFPVGATTQDGFVRTVNYYLRSGSALESESTIKTLASFDLLVLPVEAQVFNKPFFTKARTLNPDIIILAYTPTVSWNNLYWSDALHVKMLKGIKDDWWMRDAAGKKKSIWQNTTALNISTGWSDYLVSFTKTEVLSTGLWDGIFFDEVQDSIDYASPIDLDRSGKDDTATEANVRWAGAYTKLFASARTAFGSNKIIVTNGSSNAAFTPSVNGRMYETFPSTGSSLSAWASNARDYLALGKKVSGSPALLVNVNTDNTGTQTDYQKMRFGLTTTLLGDGYFGFDFGTQDHAQLWTYDEYDTYLGQAKGEPKQLGTDGKTIATTSNITTGIWGRDFEQGKVIVNGTSTAQTIRLDGEYERLHGTQDPTTNSGAIVSRLTLPAQDGIVLLRPLESITNDVYLNGAFARVFTDTGSTKRTGFFAYDTKAKGGTRVVNEDIDTDGKLETLIADATYITILDDDGKQLVKFAPYTEAFKQGINMAVGDLENDGRLEIVTGTKNGGGPQVRIFNTSGVLINPGFFAYDPAFRGGVNVAIGDLNGDKVNEIIAGAGVGGGPHVRVLNKNGKVINPGFFAYDPAFRGGVNVAVGDVDHDGIDDIVTGPGKGGGPHVRVFDKDGKLASEFFSGDRTSTDGLEVTTSDIDGDGSAEIIALSTDVFTLSTW
jgi:hypothetical protein